MSDDTQQYYILREAKQDNIPFLGPDENTVERDFSFEQQPVGSPPLIFTNSLRDRFAANGVKEFIGPVLFHGNNLVVKTSIRDALLDLQVPDMFMHPAIYIDDRDKWHEDYWYCTFTSLFDCWDRTLSEASTNYTGTGDAKRFGVYEYVLDAEVLDRTPLEKRLLFKMGGTIDAYVFCHESIAGLFRSGMPQGARLVLASDY
ncbi:hypothetical protein [Massilia sp. TWP1-3-3]|uniref:hypothetical protein n=1 Tax=Massilia sp. TWP1-3-3 TaxID=2804573 RepID=UPI003CF2F7E9